MGWVSSWERGLVWVQMFLMLKVVLLPDPLLVPSFCSGLKTRERKQAAH